jgi:hypothetical protein
MPALQKMDLSIVAGERTLWTGGHQSAEPATGAVIEKAGDQWLSFNVREEFLHGLAVGATAKIMHSGATEATPALTSELLPLEPFATWQVERAIGDHDRNSAVTPRLASILGLLRPGHASVVRWLG